MIKLILLLTITILANRASAEFDHTKFPNNTSTYLAHQVSHDGVIGINSSHIYRHLYGQDLFVDLYIANLSAVKDIYIVYGDQSHQAHWGSEYWKASLSASWRFTTQDHRDNILLRLGNLKYPGYYPGTVFTIYVVMNGRTYSNQFVLGQ